MTYLIRKRGVVVRGGAVRVSIAKGNSGGRGEGLGGTRGALREVQEVVHVADVDERERVGDREGGGRRRRRRRGRGRRSGGCYISLVEACKPAQTMAIVMKYPVGKGNGGGGEEEEAKESRTIEGGGIRRCAPVHTELAGRFLEQKLPILILSRRGCTANICVF
jgi:hypothetical protein